MTEFERRTKMSDDDPAVYKPAPGDLDKSGKLKKTKPSKHTLKFKKMFGEIDEGLPAMIGLATTCNDKSTKICWCDLVSDKQFLK